MIIKSTIFKILKELFCQHKLNGDGKTNIVYCVKCGKTFRINSSLDSI